MPLIRRADSWRLITAEIQTTYPNVLTTWATWTDAAHHNVTTLLARKEGIRWADVLSSGFGGQASGIVARGRREEALVHKPGGEEAQPEKQN